MLPTVIDPKTKIQQLSQKVSGRPSSIQPFPPKITPYSRTETKTDRDTEGEQARTFALDHLPGGRHCLVPQKSPRRIPNQAAPSAPPIKSGFRKQPNPNRSESNPVRSRRGSAPPIYSSGPAVSLGEGKEGTEGAVSPPPRPPSWAANHGRARRGGRNRGSGLHLEPEVERGRVGLCAAQRQVLTGVLSQGCFGDF